MRHSHILRECRSHTLTPPFCILRAVLYQTVELELQCSTFSQSCDSGFAQCVQARVRLRRRRRPGKVRRWDSPSPDCHLSSEELQHWSRRKRTGVSTFSWIYFSWSAWFDLPLLGVGMVSENFDHGRTKCIFWYKQLGCSAQIWSDARFVFLEYIILKP